MAFKLFRKEIKMKVKDIIERNRTVLLYDFVNRELEKALNRAKELNEKWQLYQIRVQKKD